MAAPGSFAGSGAGLPGVGQFRLDIGVGIDGYPDLDDAYRPSPNASLRRVATQGQHGAVAPSAAPQQSAAAAAASGGQFGILAPTTMLSGVMEGHIDGARHVSFAVDSHEPRRKGPGKIVVDPPDLRAWREKLFNVDDMIVLTDEQFETYFPHVDNVYSHRSTQRYKRKPFVSHYWDCRMKGRPPGTPKSDDPSKKKRKRSARERDLCDVKIRITEYFPNASAYVDREAAEAAAAAGATLPAGQRFWTIQRVNGNGGNGKGDGVAGPHRHTLERSDEIKKNSVQRYVAQQEKQARKMQVCLLFSSLIMLRASVESNLAGFAEGAAEKSNRCGGDACEEAFKRARLEALFLLFLPVLPKGVDSPRGQRSTLSILRNRLIQGPSRHSRLIYYASRS
ncbi:hypothetical protein J3458_017278 [Metarhizium acridum]|uniref:uncharacterized protein n=1 Tax=Metarhizium acridum TaxID=92637 RepID=UPI001C6CBC1F|nr:hypothetical protein J3458_017278 [Metarhizium acridum]